MFQRHIRVFLHKSNHILNYIVVQHSRNLFQYIFYLHKICRSIENVFFLHLSITACNSKGKYFMANYVVITHHGFQVFGLFLSFFIKFIYVFAYSVI